MFVFIIDVFAGQRYVERIVKTSFEDCNYDLISRLIDSVRYYLVIDNKLEKY